MDIERGPTIRVLIAGSGKLASELLENLKAGNICAVLPWDQRDEAYAGRQIAVHAGSGRELGSITEFCSRTGSLLIELSTNGGLDTSKICFPAILCPNINILMLKLMAMLQDHGNHFKAYEKSILESHQSTKTSKPGTAINFADSLGVGAERIISVRDPAAQEHEIGIPSAFLSRHAYHKITISDANASISIEAKVLGQAPYASGLAQIIEGIGGRDLAPGIYDELALIHNGWV